MNDLEIKLKMYEEAFGESFPTFNFTYLDEEQIGQIIDSCLDAEKDVYEMGYASDDMNIKY